MTSINVLKRKLLQRGKVFAVSNGHDGEPQEELRLELMVARAEARSAVALLSIGSSALSTNRQQVSQLDLQKQLDIATTNLILIQQRCIEHGVSIDENGSAAQ